jgi:hypothetical protein
VGTGVRRANVVSLARLRAARQAPFILCSAMVDASFGLAD